MLSIGFNLTGYLIFAFVTSITPGPNNYLLFYYGRHYGFKSSGNLMFGIFLGFFVLLYAAGYGIAEIISASSTIEIALKILSSAWLLYLALMLSRISPQVEIGTGSKTGFMQGFIMQFINPKAWIMAITGASAFLPDFGNFHLNVFVFAISFGIVGIPCMITWISFGDIIARMLKSEKANRIIGLIMFTLMLLSIVMIWI